MIGARDSLSDGDLASYDPDRLPRREDGLGLLMNDAMRARRRPWAIGWTWAWEGLLALLVAFPAASAVSAVYGGHPRGDAVLWTPGALELTDLVAREASGRSSIVVLAALVLIVAAVVDLVPLSALLVSIAFATRDRRAPSMRAAFARGAASIPALCILMIATVAVQIVVLLLGALAAAGVTTGLVDRVGEARADQLGWLVALVFLFVATVVGVAHDLARAAAVRFRVRTIRAIQLGLNTLRRTPSSLVFSWAWRALAALLPIAIGSLVADRVGLRGGGALFALFVVHQLALASRMALRASWLAKALRAVDHAHRVVRR